jgi:superfamily II DNA or RNA helicase
MDFPWNMWPDPPREWQVRAYETLIPMVRGRRCVMAQACTGAGKTRFQLAVIANVLATLRPGWVIVVSVPKQSLVEQTYEAARAVLPSGSVGRWYGNRKDPSRVTVVCHASAGSFVDYLGSQSQRIAFWMADEAHRADGDVLVEVIQRANPYTRLGLTATPFPPTGSAALRGWEEIAFRYTLDEAVRDGVLVPFRFVQFGRSNEDANEAVIEMIHRDAPPGPGLVSATDIVDAEWYAGQLSDNGIPAVAVHSKLRKGEEAKRIAALLRGEYRAMVHVDLLTEGRDIPGLRWLAARRPRGSAIAIAQEAGRISRVCRDDDPTVAWAGPKTEAVILMPRYVPVLESVMQVGEVTPELTAERLQAAAEREAAAPTRMQFALLEDLERDPRKGAVKYLPKSGREVVREVLKRPGILTCGEVQDLLRLLRGVRSYAVKYAEQRHYLPVERRFWRGMQEAKAVLDPAAERSLRGGG